MTIEALHRLFLNSKGVSTDTRSIEKEHIFFALKGSNFNGNEFAQKALLDGASYAVVDEIHYSKGNQFILVENVLNTLQELAKFHRNYLGIPIIALTGSNGKTTTKELINSVLSRSYNTYATKGNFNNHIGVPLTLLQMDQSIEIGIVEMGANHIGEIADLCRIAHPNFGYITNFGKAHLEGFGSEEGVIQGKSELYDHLKNNGGTILVNVDDSKQVKQLGSYNNVITFSQNKSTKFQVELISDQPFLKVKFQNTEIKTNLIGRYNFTNIAAAIAIGQHLQVDIYDLKKGIELYHPKNNRSQILNQNSNTIVLDAYNANPTSMVAALENFKLMDGQNKVVILGDMFELGNQSDSEHQAIIELALSFNFKKTIFVGSHFFKHISKDSNAYFFENTDDLKIMLQKESINDSTVLLKGSRGMALENILETL